MLFFFETNLIEVYNVKRLICIVTCHLRVLGTNGNRKINIKVKQVW